MKPFDPTTYLKEVLGPHLESAELPGLFERYCLDPADADEQAIADRCKEVKQLWDRRVEQPKYGGLVRTLLGAHGEALLTLEDPDERRRAAAQAAAAESERAQAGDRARNDWEELLAVALAQNEGLDPAIRSQLERAGERFGLDAALVREKLDAAPVAAVRAELSDAERKEIRRALTALAQDSGEPRTGLTLYHALGLSGVTRDVAEISRRHAQVESDNDKRSRDNTRVVCHTVLVIAKRILIDGDPRAYEESLVAEVQDELAAKGFRAAFDDGVIDEAEAEQLTRRGVELGLSQELARRVVTQIARDNGVPLHTGAPVDYLVCGACGAVAARERASERCESCGAELFVRCPNGDCGEVNDASAGRCRKCGADLHEYTAAMRRLPELERMIRDGLLQQAADELALAERALGTHEQLARIARELAGATERAKAEWSEAERAISRRELYAARAALQRLRTSAGDLPGPESLTAAERLAWVGEQLRTTEQALVRARGASGREREAILAEALAIAADCREAGEQLDRIPASPSPAVRAALRGAEVLIEWDPSPTVGVAYELVRVESDGSRVELGSGPLSACEAVDGAVESGAVVRYELLAVRGASRSTSVTSEPLLVARELQQLEVFSGDREVRVSWAALGSRGRALLTRRHDASGAEQSLAAESTGLTDRGLENGERYTYRARVEYPGLAGEPVITTGTVIYGQPVARPLPVAIVAAEPTPQGVRISFDPPPAGAVTVLRCEDQPALGAGDRLDVGDLAALGTVVPPDAGGALDPDPQSGNRWYVPVTVAATMAVVGEPYRCLALPGVANVRAVDDGAEVRVTWTWPEALRAAIVVWRRDRQPEGPEDAAAERRVFRRGEYRDHGGFAIDGAAEESVFVTVYPAARVDGEYQFGTSASRESRAALTRARKTDVRYAVKRSGLRRKRVEIGVFEPDGPAVPELVVVVRPGDLLPRQPADGEVVARLGGGGPLSSTLELDGRSRPLALRAFLSRPGASSSHRVLDPGVEELVIR